MAGPNNGSRKMSHVTTSMEELMSSEFCNKKFQFQLTALVIVILNLLCKLVFLSLIVFLYEV